MKKTIPQDAADFIVAYLFANEGEDRPELVGKSIYDFSPAFVAGVESFCSGFREFCEWRGVEIPHTERSLGGNVYFSLSGHGVGFWDDSETAHLQPELVEYSGNKYRFESMEICENEAGELDLGYIPSKIESYREKQFTVAPWSSAFLPKI